MVWTGEMLRGDEHLLLKPEDRSVNPTNQMWQHKSITPDKTGARYKKVLCLPLDACDSASVHLQKPVMRDLASNKEESKDQGAL